MPIKTKYTNRKNPSKKADKMKDRSQSISTFVHFNTGVLPIMLIKTQNQQKKTGKNRPSEIRLSGVPPIMPIKTKHKKNIY